MARQHVSDVRNILTSLLVLLLPGCVTSNISQSHSRNAQRQLMTPMEMNTKLLVDHSLMLFPVSLDTCSEECLSRATCSSLSYQRSAKLCFLHKKHSASTGTVLQKTSGYVYKEKVTTAQTHVPECASNCSDAEVCCLGDGSVTCETRECSMPPILADSFRSGNDFTIGSRIQYTCQSDTTKTEISTCLPNGQWSLRTFECIDSCPVFPAILGGLNPYFSGNRTVGSIATVTCGGVFHSNVSQTTCLPSLEWSEQMVECYVYTRAYDGMTAFIYKSDLTIWWHADPSYGNDYISYKWQPVGAINTKFRFELQTDDSYRIYGVGSTRYLFDGYDATGAQMDILNIREDPNDDHCRFYILTTETNDFVRIATKSTGRVVRMDEGDKFVSSRKDIWDGNALFKIEPIP